MGSPAAATVGTDGDFFSVMCGAVPATTVAVSSSVTTAPRGASAAARAVLTIDPRSTSPWLTVYVHEYSHVSPTSSRSLPLVSPEPKSGEHNGSVTPTELSVALP